MKKKVVALLLAGLAVCSLCSCGKPKTQSVAFVSSPEGKNNTINRDVLAGAKAFAEGRQVEFLELTAKGNTPEEIGAALKEACEKGASTIVCQGAEFEIPVGTSQKENSGVKFLMVQSMPKKENGKKKIGGNSCAVTLPLEQAGYLAGYAAVKEGYFSLGFLAGSDNKENLDYLAGYLQGCERAGTDLELSESSVNVAYSFLGSERISPMLEKKVRDWYNGGIKCLFASGNAAEYLAEVGAANTDGKWIGADREAQDAEHRVACLNIDFRDSSKQVLEQLSDGGRKWGKLYELSSEESKIGIYWESSKLSSDTTAALKALETELSEGKTKIGKVNSQEELASLKLKYVSFVLENV